MDPSAPNDDSPASPGDVTLLLSRIKGGEDGAVGPLFELLYRELRRLAASAMRAERADHLLQPTALVHETFLRLADDAGSLENRRHFFGVAAMAMRRILVEHARARRAAKRGGGVSPVPLTEVAAPAPEPDRGVDVEALDQALTRLAAVDARQARVVELRYFAGFSLEETADLVGVSTRTVKRDWQMASAWLRREMSRLAAPPR